MSRRSMALLFTLVFLTFVGVMDYPFLARMYNDRAQGRVVRDYQEQTARTEEQKREAEFQKAEAYNRALATGTGEKIREAAEEEWDHGGYEDLLCTDDEGLMALVEIPAIHVMLPVYHGTSEDVLQKGAGHLEGTSLPTGGAGFHTALSAHRGLPEKKMFTDLDQLEEGDTFYIHVLGEIHAYEVIGVETVRPDETESLAARPGEDLATLVTCTPYGINTHRLYIHGERIPYEEEIREEEGRMEADDLWKDWWWLALTGGLFVWYGLLLRYFLRNTEKGQETEQNK